MSQLLEIFKKLEYCKPYRLPTSKTRFDFVANLFLLIAVVCITLLAILMIYFFSTGIGSEIIYLAASLLVFLISCLVVLAMLTKLIKELFDFLFGALKNIKVKIYLI